MFTKVFALLSSLPALAIAQYASEPFAIHITGKTNSSIDGYVGACHAGAAIEGLCYEAAGPTVPGPYDQYYLNATSPNGTQGVLVWELPLSNGDGTYEYIPSAMTLFPNYGSNVAIPLFYPGVEYSLGTTYITLDNGTVSLSGGPDDSNNNATYPDPVHTLGDLTSWNVCYQFTGGYYYYSIGWVFGTQPSQNPSCEPVQLTIEPVSTAVNATSRR